MQKVRFIGRDVHKDSITVAVADGTGPAEVVATTPNEMGAVLKAAKFETISFLGRRIS